MPHKAVRDETKTKKKPSDHNCLSQVADILRFFLSGAHGGASSVEADDFESTFAVAVVELWLSLGLSAARADTMGRADIIFLELLTQVACVHPKRFLGMAHPTSDRCRVIWRPFVLQPVEVRAAVTKVTTTPSFFDDKSLTSCFKAKNSARCSPLHQDRVEAKRPKDESQIGTCERKSSTRLNSDLSSALLGSCKKATSFPKVQSSEAFSTGAYFFMKSLSTLAAAMTLDLRAPNWMSHSVCKRWW